VIRGTPKSSIGVEIRGTQVLMVAEVEEDTQQRRERRRVQERTLSRLVKVEIASRVVPEKMKARAQMEARKKIIRHVISYTA
jgi:tRNA(Ser,Leu) C12 N-acetylase TAN1